MQFNDNELFFRMVSHYPNLIKSDGSISSALFKNPNGCSVDRKGDRKVNAVYASLIDRFGKTQYGIKGVAELTYRDCKDGNVYVKEAPSLTNEYHCELHKSESEILLTSAQARYLAMHCKYNCVLSIIDYKV